MPTASVADGVVEAVERVRGEARDLSNRYPLRLVSVYLCWKLDAAGRTMVRLASAGVRFDDRRRAFDADGFRWVRADSFRGGARVEVPA